MSRSLACLLACLFLAIFLGSLAGAPGASAGAGGEENGNEDADGDTTSAASGDTSGSEEPEEGEVDASAARRSGRRFSPTYTSGYEVNRNTSTWTQGLTFMSWAGPVDITSSSSVSIGKDKTLDRDRRNRTANFGFAYRFPAGLRVGSSLGLVRNFTVDAGRTSSSQNSERFSINGDYERNLAPGLTGTFRVAGGTSHDQRADPLTSNRESTGPHGEASADLTLKSWGDWSLRSSIRNARLNSTEDRTHHTTRDNNLTRETGITWGFKVPGFNTWTLSAGRRLNRIQYPLAARQETNTNETGDLSLGTSTSPWPRFTLSGNLSYSNNNVDREIDLTRSQESIDRAGDWKLNYQFGDSTTIELRQNWSVSRSLYEDPLRLSFNGDIRTRSLGGSLRRPIGRRAKIDMAGRYDIQSYLFDDPERNPEDRDVVHGDFSSNLEYNPMEKIKSNIRFSFQHNQTIFLDASRSSTNQTQQIYSVSPSFEYKLNSRISFREDGVALANANIFDFDENQNRLSRQTELRSTIDTRLFTRFGFSLRHAYRFLQDGSYRREEDGVRRFSKSREDTSRDLTFMVDYRPVSGISANFRANERLTDTVTRAFRSGQFVNLPSTTEFNEIEIGCRATRKLHMGLDVSVDVKRFQSWTSSNSRNNYWDGSINISHRF